MRHYPLGASRITAILSGLMCVLGGETVTRAQYVAPNQVVVDQPFDQAVVEDGSPSAIDAAGDPFAEFDPTGPLMLSGTFADGEDPTVWQVHYQPDAQTPDTVPIQFQISAGTDGTYGLASAIPVGSVSQNGAYLIVTSPNAPNSPIQLWIDPTAGFVTVNSPVIAPEPGPAPPATNVMRLQLQFKNYTYSIVPKQNNGPETVAQMNAALDQLFNAYTSRAITTGGPPSDKATSAAFLTAIQQVKKVVAGAPPNGVSGDTNVMRKNFTDSRGNQWRIDVENKRGKKPHEVIHMSDFDSLLMTLDKSDLEAKRRLLGDLGELLGRNTRVNLDQDPGCFDSPEIEALPVHLEPMTIAQIARRVGPVLLDQAEDTSIRVTAAFVLGKTFDPGALATVARAVSSPETLPRDVGRQCGFSFDTLWESCGPGDPPVDLDAVEAGFKALGVPWNDQTRTVAADEI